MASRWIPQGEVRLRARSGPVFLVLVGIVTVSPAVAALMRPDPTTAAIVVTAMAGAMLGWVYFGRPRLRVADDAITVVNPWREHRVPWHCLADIETRYQLTLVTADARYAALAAPGPGGREALRAAERGVPTPEHKAETLGARPGDVLDTDAANAARLIRGHWQDLVNEGALDIDDPERPTSRIVWPVVLASVGLPLLSVLLWVVT